MAKAVGFKAKARLNITIQLMSAREAVTVYVISGYDRTKLQTTVELDENHISRNKA